MIPKESGGDRGVLNISLLSAYHARSQAHWARELMNAISRLGGRQVSWRLLSLPPRYFGMRIRGAAFSWWDELAGSPAPDLIIATSSVDLAAVLGCFPQLRNVPSLYYLHENQFAYPDSGRQEAVHRNDVRLVQLYSALAADRVAFNSRWNRDSFFSGARELIEGLPEALSPDIINSIGEKSMILPIPVRGPEGESDQRQASETEGDSPVPHFIWPHRWEYDKGPELLLEFCRILREQGREFRISLLGQRFRSRPRPFADLFAEFERELVQPRPIEDGNAYLSFLRSCAAEGNGWVLSTAGHEFFGIAVMEGVLAGLLPLVPDGLSYRELIAGPWRYPLPEPEDSIKTAHADPAFARRAARSIYRVWEKLDGQRQLSQAIQPGDLEGILLLDPRPAAVLPAYIEVLEELLSQTRSIA
jgi:glycosyltransferase involved in cell wall biosynthesis